MMRRRQDEERDRDQGESGVRLVEGERHVGQLPTPWVDSIATTDAMQSATAIGTLINTRRARTAAR